MQRGRAAPALRRLRPTSRIVTKDDGTDAQDHMRGVPALDSLSEHGA
jgi:hypothetical protein